MSVKSGVRETEAGRGSVGVGVCVREDDKANIKRINK